MSVASASSFSELLNVFWLRPETALWRELDIRAMREFEFRSPSLDLGCGDGLFSFVRAGGAFDESFDAFGSMRNLEGFFENIDVFDAFDGRVFPEVSGRPKYSIDVGFDHKLNLLKKSERLGFYRELKLGDANKPLPFEDNSFNSIFSNIVYWLNDPKAAIFEVARVLRPGGNACLMLPNRTFPDFSFYNQLHLKTNDPKWAFLEKLDRGRFSDNIKQSKSSEEWGQIFGEADLQVVEHKTHLSKTVIQIWDVGFRPLFPVLLRMVSSIPKDELLEIKRDWISTVHQFLEPIVQMDADLGRMVEPAFHCYVLRK